LLQLRRKWFGHCAAFVGAVGGRYRVRDAADRFEEVEVRTNETNQKI